MCLEGRSCGGGQLQGCVPFFYTSCLFIYVLRLLELHYQANHSRFVHLPTLRLSISCSTAQVQKPVPKSLGDYTSISLASSYMHSVVSSNFMLLFSTTDGSSMPSAIFDHKSCDKSKTNAFSTQLKKLHYDPRVEGPRGFG